MGFFVLQRRIMKNKLLSNLCNIDGIPGHEGKVFDLLKTELTDSVDSITSDNLGSFISQKGDKGLKVMLAAHMDEVGFVVKYIDNSGFIYFQPAGGWWAQVLLAQQVIIHTYDGKKINGFIGCKAPHILPIEKRSEMVKIEDMFIDIGVDSKDEVEQSGIQIGDMIVPKCEYYEMVNPKYLFGKAMDNRIGCAIMVDVMKNIADLEINNQVFGVATVQEEVGLRGATTASNKINPDISIAIDTSIAGDTPKMKPNEAMAEIGKGPVAIVMDATTIGNVELRRQIVEVAKSLNIEIQFDFLVVGGTDAGRMHLAHDGSPAISLAIATRYIHSHGSIVHEDDYYEMVAVITKFIIELTGEKYQKMLSR